jgi:hypothetical protein
MSTFTSKKNLAVSASIMLSFLATADDYRLTDSSPAQASPLDKNGTTGCPVMSRTPQLPLLMAVAQCGCFGAERGGFEPPVRFDPHTAFPVLHNRPLCHLSMITQSFI